MILTAEQILTETLKQVDKEIDRAIMTQAEAYAQDQSMNAKRRVSDCVTLDHAAISKLRESMQTEARARMMLGLVRMSQDQCPRCGLSHSCVQGGGSFTKAG